MSGEKSIVCVSKIDIPLIFGHVTLYLHLLTRDHFTTRYFALRIVYFACISKTHSHTYTQTHTFYIYINARV